MALDTYSTIWNKVKLRCPTASSFLCQDWVTNAYRRVYLRRPWSWRLKHNQFVIPAAYTTGTVDVTLASATVSGTSTVWTDAMIGRQFRLSGSNPVYTITARASATSMTIDTAWGETTATGETYSIWQAYVTPATDFAAFQTVYDPANNWDLRTNITRQQIDAWDPQRGFTGNAYCVAAFDYSATSGTTPGYPRYELWPHVTSAAVYPYTYVAIPTDLADSGAVIPRYLNGNILLEMALAEAARWPGLSKDEPNPYFDLKLAQMHEANAERMLLDLEREDDEIYLASVSYSRPVAPLPFGDADWLRSHSI